MQRSQVLCGMALMLAVSSLPVVAQTKVVKEAIFAPGSVSFPSSHASTVVELKGGELLSAWFGGTGEGKPDVAIWGARKSAAGWSAPVELAREPDVPCWNPVLFHTRDGVLWLYYKFGPTPATWTAARKFSSDEGRTWSAADYIPAGLVGPVRAKPLVLDDGTIVSGSSVEAYRSWAVWVERSTDGGKTWVKTGPIVPPTENAKAELSRGPAPVLPGSTKPKDSAVTRGIIQPSVVSLGGKHLRLYARSTPLTQRVVVSDSYDAGVTWTPGRTLDVPNPNSGLDAVALRDGRVVMIYNNTPTGRTPLNLAVSTDGEHFRMFYTLEDTPEGEFSYPAIIQAANGDLEMTYTWQRKTIEHVHFPLAEVPK
ncbi:exo-alpha-sialidase [soil metagenome]